MTMDEVNERFPLVKYKAWMTTRAEEGLPTAGGVAAPSASRAASLRNAEGVLANIRKSNDEPRPSTPTPKESSEEQGESPESIKTSTEIVPSPKPQSPTKEVAETKKEEEDAKEGLDQEKKGPHVETVETSKTLTSTSHAPLTTVASSSDPADDDLDDDDQIQMAVPSEMLANPGDSCAICIDTLEDDDDVRGLTCGHAFHASCLDPWLTSRRACCPLCKADYYVPKPRPEGEAAAEADRHDRGRRPPGSRMDMPRPPQYAFQRNGGSRMLFPGRFMPGSNHGRARYQFPGRIPRSQSQMRDRRERNLNSTLPPPPNPEESTTPSSPPAQAGRTLTWRSRMRSFVHTVPSFTIPMSRRNSNSNATLERNNNTTEPVPPLPANPTTTTPSQLEAGQR